MEVRYRKICAAVHQHLASTSYRTGETEILIVEGDKVPKLVDSVRCTRDAQNHLRTFATSSISWDEGII